MFGIGLPEMILILGLALIVVGPDKLPELARSLAKGLMELKKTAEGFKEQLKEEGNLLDDVRPDLEDAAKTLKNHMLEHSDKGKKDLFQADGKTTPTDNAAKTYEELTQAGTDPSQIHDESKPLTDGTVAEMTEVVAKGDSTPDSSSEPEDETSSSTSRTDSAK